MLENGPNQIFKKHRSNTYLFFSLGFVKLVKKNTNKFMTTTISILEGWTNLPWLDLKRNTGLNTLPSNCKCTKRVTKTYYKHGNPFLWCECKGKDKLPNREPSPIPLKQKSNQINKIQKSVQVFSTTNQQASQKLHKNYCKVPCNQYKMNFNQHKSTCKHDKKQIY